MVVNGLAVPNVDKTNEFGVGGSSAETAQIVTLRFDLADGSLKKNQLRTVAAGKGKVKHVKLDHVSGTIYEAKVRIGGGLGELFWWDV